MSFNVNKGKSSGKRLATKRDTSTKKPVEIGSDLVITQYSEKSIVVMGDTLNHSGPLTTLGGKYMQLKTGMGWLFAKFREPSVQKYIETGEVVPYVYSKEDRERFQNRSASSTSTNTGIGVQELRTIFQQCRDAFDADEEYEGSAIINVLDQIEELHLQKLKAGPVVKKPEPAQDVKLASGNKRLARKIPVKKSESEDSESEMEDESLSFD